MSSSVSNYSKLPEFRSPLLNTPQDTLPQSEDLIHLQKELAEYKGKALERIKKAADDARLIEDAFRRMKEKEKGKAKAIQKAERERGYTPSVNGDEGRNSAQPSSQPPKNRAGANPPPPLPTPTPSFIELRKHEELKKNKKKKRKREEDSDIEPDPPKIRKASPLPVHTPSHPPAPPKTSKYPSTSIAFAKPTNAPDFALPASTPLLPARPPIAPRPVAGPSKQSDVTEDFSKSKQPNQVQVTTFYTSIEPWLRPIKEEDVGFLEYTADEVEPFVMPKVGRHYSQVWGEEDIAAYGAPLPGTAARHPGPPSSSSGALPPLTKWEPSTLAEPDLLTEERGHGPLTERVVSALVPMHDATEWKGVKAAEEAMEGRPGTNGAAAAAARDKLNVADLEDRMKLVARHHGLLDDNPDYSEAVDDPIATALRHAQRELRTVLATNKARRLRLAEIAQQRLGYQEYVEQRDLLDRQIASSYAKLQKNSGPKASKKKKPPHHSKAGSDTPAPLTGILALPPCPAALGLAPDEHNMLHVPELLNNLVTLRRQWVDEVGARMEEIERESPGRLWGFPQESVFQGVDEEVRVELARVAAAPPVATAPVANGVAHTNGVGAGRGLTNGAAPPRTAFNFSFNKGKARGVDEMDVG